MKVARLGILLCLPLAMGLSQEAVQKNTEANTLYAEGRFEEAKKLYVEARELEPESRELLFNAAITTGSAE